MDSCGIKDWNPQICLPDKQRNSGTSQNNALNLMCINRSVNYFQIGLFGIIPYSPQYQFFVNDFMNYFPILFVRDHHFYAKVLFYCTSKKPFSMVKRVPSSSTLFKPASRIFSPGAAAICRKGILTLCWIALQHKCMVCVHKISKSAWARSRLTAASTITTFRASQSSL